MTNRTKAIASLAGVFVLGLLCGGLALGLFVRDQVRERDRLKNPEGFREYFADELSLSTAQRDSLQAELELVYQQMADIRYQVEQEYREVFDTLSARLDPVLNSTQKKRLSEEKKRLLPDDRHANGEAVSFPLEEIERRAADDLRSRENSAGVQGDSGVKAEEVQTVATAPELDSGTEEEYEGDVYPGDSIFSPQTKEEHLPGIVAFMKTSLNLDSEQTDQVDAALRKAVRRNRWIRTNLKDQPMVRRRRLGMSFRLLDRQIAGILNKEQRAVYNDFKKDRREAAERRRNERRGAGK